ncbi:substrate-binding domain-containing protein [Larsenimonas salina]|uniref:helix-turn-helix transcriptional regulator n=1 Tax=Larsenimonas salina TaxID=1295565 RepID=UPI002073E387|nr:substrate-binding domain-containing protein [Larsenimonas salina]MCM5705507.1 helix-turn-helix transcriptional regulator [Larsenimonas salina]
MNIAPAWLFRSEDGDLLDPVTFTLLSGIHETGKLTRAAQQAGISYRHAWNLLTRGEQFFGMAMVVMRKGHGTHLSPLGERLLWSEQRLRARLEPQLDSMASELNNQIQQLLEGAHPVLRLHASHGYAVALLPELAGELDLRYCNPIEALSALKRGDCDLASLHLPADPTRAERVLATYRPLIHDQDLRIIRFVTRKQGLILRAETRERVQGLADLTQPGLRFINRDEHSGTRLLFNLLLDECGLDEIRLAHATQEEFTHTAVAAYVAAGMADVGFGVEAAAAQFGLDFIDLAHEHYLLVCHTAQLNQHNVCQLLDAMTTPEFLASLERLTGYEPDHCGTIGTFDDLTLGHGRDA